MVYDCQLLGTLDSWCASEWYHSRTQGESEMVSYMWYTVGPRKSCLMREWVILLDCRLFLFLRSSQKRHFTRSFLNKREEAFGLSHALSSSTGFLMLSLLLWAFSCSSFSYSSTHMIHVVSTDVVRRSPQGPTSVECTIYISCMCACVCACVCVCVCVCLCVCIDCIILDIEAEKHTVAILNHVLLAL